jgi:hypothetical protein
MVVVILILVLHEFKLHLLIELLQFPAAQLFLHSCQRACPELEDQHALLLLAACELVPIALLTVSHHRGGFPSLHQLLSHSLQHLDSNELPVAGQAGPKLVDILEPMFKGIFDLALSFVVETADFEQVSLNIDGDTLSLLFWLRLLTASSRYSSS